MATDAPAPHSASWHWSLLWASVARGVRWPFSLAALAAVLLFATPSPAAEVSAAPTWTDHLEVVAPAMPTEWTTVSAPYLRISGAPKHLDTMIRLSDHGAEALPRLSDALGVPIGGTVHVYLVSTDAEFHELQPGDVPFWADAVAYPALGAIYLRDPSARDGTAKPLEQVFDHELVHIVLGRAFAPKVPPSWLQEGVAQVLAGEAGPEIATTIHEGVARGGLIPFEELEHGFPRDALKAQLAYAQSADFIAWLRAEHGPKVIPDLVAATQAGAEMPAAVRGVTGELLENVEARWAERFPSTWALTGLNVLGESFLFGLGGVLLAVGGLMRKRRFHQRMEELEREEAMVDELMARMASRGEAPRRAAGGWTH